MKQVFTILFLFVAGLLASAQQPQLSKPQSAEYYVTVLENSKDSLYDEIIRRYDSYISAHPEDFLVQIERCKFLETAYYDDEEGYNPKEEDAVSCREALVEAFPGVPEVLIYNAEYQWGDSGIAVLKDVIKDFDRNSEKWEGKEIWKVYHQLASTYEFQEHHEEAIEYAKLAREHNDTLDVTLMLGQQYKALSQNKDAIEALVSDLDSTDKYWELNAKGKLLLELGAPKEALKAFHLAKKDTSAWVDDEALAKAMIENGLYAEAREYLVKAADVYWNKGHKLRKLFDYDIKYSPVDSARATYVKLNEDGFSNDLFGIYRLRLFFNSPLSGWTFRDALHLLLLLALVAAVFIVPYVWILPIHYLGNYFRNRGMIVSPSSFRWGLKSFWMASSLILLVNLASLLIFMYDDILSDSEEAVVDTVSKQLADTTVFYFFGLAVVTLFLLRKNDIEILWGIIWSKSKSILTGIGMAFLIKFALGIFMLGLKRSDISFPMEDGGVTLTIVDHIVSINRYYHPVFGFFIVALLVPLYEEIIFRGIFLGALQKYMKFFLANILQAGAFAAMHIDWKLFPFYFTFGLVAGYYRQKSQSLAPGISMHITNNFVAFIAILVRNTMKVGL